MNRGRGTLGAALFCVGLLGLGGAAWAFEPELPAGARLTAERASALDVFAAPVGVFGEGVVPAQEVEGRILRRAWRIDIGGLTPLQVMVPLRRQLAAEGFEIVFECPAMTCGGFDFRFNTEVLPGPNMYVNIARYRYLTARRGAAGAPDEVVSILASVTAESAYVQVVTAEAVDSPALPAPPSPAEGAVAPAPEAVAPAPQSVAPQNLEQRLFAQGHVALDDLDFAFGTSDLGPGPHASLASLAQVLARRPSLRIALVGHTDAVGGLEGNIAVSRARARSVRDRLIGEYGVAAARLEAEGMGYLAPVASNLTEEGRARNRRVEAVLLSED